MVLTQNELIGALQHEVNVLQHLCSKVEPSMLTFRPTPKQRSTRELLDYLAVMGPVLVKSALAGGFVQDEWVARAKAASELSFDELVKALAIGPREKGGRTLLSIRPERVEINPTAQTADVILPGRIAELIYLGDHIRARLEVAGDDNFIVKVPNKGATTDVAEGREVKVGWKAADCRALDYAEFRH